MAASDEAVADIDGRCFENGSTAAVVNNMFKFGRIQGRLTVNLKALLFFLELLDFRLSLDNNKFITLDDVTRRVANEILELHFAQVNKDEGSNVKQPDPSNILP